MDKFFESYGLTEKAPGVFARKADNFDDEEIDEGGAFGESEDDFGMGKDDSDDESISENSGDEEDEDFEGGMLLSDMIKEPGTTATATVATHSSDESSDDDDDENVDVSQHDGMLAKLQELASGSKPKASGKQRFIAERTEAESEGQFAPQAVDGEDDLNVADLMGAFKDESKLGDLKKQLLTLKHAKETLATPVAKSLEDKAIRDIAYKNTSKDMGKWQDLVTLYRRADHISFSKEAAAGTKHSVTTGFLTSKFKPSNDFEGEIANILKGAGINAAGLETQETSELEKNEYTEEELLARQKQLQKLKTLMHYKEQKQRWQNKIKSKAYRRIKKRQKEKQTEAEKERLRELDPEAAAELDLKEAADIARERATQRHRNKGKWVRWVLKHGKESLEKHKDDILTRIRRAEQLRRKIAGTDANSDSSAEDSDPEGSDEESKKNHLMKPFERARSRLMDGIRDMDEEDQEGDEKHKGIFKLKFMQDALVRQREEAREEAKRLLQELEADQALVLDNVDLSSKKADNDDEATGVSKTGRKSFTGANASARRTRSSSNAQDDEELDLQAAGRSTRTVLQPSASKGSSAEANPWMVDGTSNAFAGSASETPAGGASKSGKSGASISASGVVDFSKTMKQLNKAQAKKQKQAATNAAAKGNGTAVLVDDDTTAAGQPKRQKGVKAQMAGNGNASDSDSDSGSDGGAGDAELLQLQQEELVRRAFAGAGALEEVQADKAAELEQQMPAEKKISAGWGSWAGIGVSAPKRTAQKRKRKALKREIQEKRQDNKLSHVVISEKKSRQLSKYQVGEVPYPFTSREQYEAAMAQPVGKEWNTRTMSSQMAKPKVVTRAGVIIEPLKYRNMVKTGLPVGVEMEALPKGLKKRMNKHKQQMAKKTGSNQKRISGGQQPKRKSGK